MSKRPKSELNPIKQPPVHTSAKNQPKNTTKSQDNSILNIVVGSLNVKRWKELKNAFSCKTNEKFITQLLDIAQQYLQGHPSKPNVKAKAKPQSPKQIATNNNVETKLEPEPEEIKRKPTLPSKSKPTVKTEPAIKKRQNEYDVRKAPELEIQTTIENIKIEKVEKTSDDKVCYNCYTNHAEDDCPINYPHCIIHDSTINKTNLEDDAQSFSYLSLPRALYLDKGWSGVFAKTNLNPFTEFGPLIGTPIKEVDISEDSSMRDIWEIVNHDGNVYLNTENSEVANWLRFMRPAASREDRNVTVNCKEGKLYFISIREIRKDEELVYWQDSCFLSNKKKLEKTSCGGCNMTFSHPLYYRTHCSVFHDVRYSLTIRKYHCKVCGAAVLGKENIMKHAAELHNGQGAYQCQFCKKFFLRLNYLEMHRTYGCSANPHRSRPLCDFCGKKFCQPQKLKVHIKRMHSDIADVIKEFQCKSCLKILGSRAALQRHLKEVHQKQLDGACSCTRCGKHFQNKSNLKIHMLTHSGIKPFKCIVGSCNAAFTTKQCLQFHYKKVHSFMEETMPKIERSIDYTFQAYSGFEDELDKNNEMDSDMEDASLDSKSMDDPPASQSPLEVTDEPPPSPPPQLNPASPIDYQQLPSPTIKIASKGSKKWIADEPLKLLKSPELYRINKDDLSNLNLPEPEIYDRNKIDFATRQDASNASLLVEAALDSVCSEPNIDIDVSSTPNCTTDSLVNNLYTLTQPDALPEVTYSDNLMSPSVNDHISVTDELNDELRHSHSIGMDYSNFHQEDFSPANSPNMHQRSNFVRNYINNLSPQNYKSPSPPRYDFGHAHESDDSNNGMSAQNLSLNNSKNEIQLDLSIYKSYKLDYQQRRLKFDGELSPGSPRKLLGVDSLVNSSVMDGIEGVEVDVEKEADRSKYPDDLSSEIRNKFELDLDLRLKNYELDRTYVENEVDFRGKSYDLNLESDFRTTDRNFEPLLLNNGSEIQGLDMSARSFHNYPINRYHHLYPEVDRINYSPPPPPPPYADILRVVSLDLTPPGRHSVDLSLRPHPFANSRLLSEHPLHQTNSHRLPMLGSDLSTGRLLTDHTTNRILVNDQSSHLIEDSRILTESRLLPSTPSGSVSPVPTFSGYSVSQSPYHPTPLAARSHVTSPTSTPYHHYSSYY